MQEILTCLREGHDAELLALAGFVCIVGVYGSFSVSHHAWRAEGRIRTRLVLMSLVAAGSTAWATHMIAMLAYKPGMPAGFEPVLTAISLLIGTLGIGLGMAISAGRRSRLRRLGGGLVLGIGTILLHYLGQYAFLVRGRIEWDPTLVTVSIVASLPIFALSMMMAGERNRSFRPLGAPLLVLAIAILHVSGMAALRLTYDPYVLFPPLTIEPQLLAPIVAAVCLGLFAVSLFGLRLTLKARAKLVEDQQRLGELANLAFEGLAVCGKGVVLSANEELSRLTGRPRDILVGQTISSLLPGLSLADITEGEEMDAELSGDAPDLVPVRVLRREFKLGGTSQTVIAFRDQRERLRTEEKIRTLAYSDTLTGLANRERFSLALDKAVVLFESSQTPFTALLIDLDGFKLVNDTQGHSGGDEVLKIVADRLRAALAEEPDHDLARLSGDEFAVLIGGTNDPVHASAIGERIIRSIKEPLALRGQTVHISASVGIAAVDERYASAEQVFRNADLALYDAKMKGRSRVSVFSQALRNAANDKANTAIELQEAFEDGDLELYYQPQIRLSDGALVGAEALIRWNYPYRGVLSPGLFLPVLEAGPLAEPVGTWILATACQQAARWRAAGAEDFQIGVNLFAAQLRSREFASLVQSTLDSCSLPPEALELEVTENIILRNEAATIARLAELRDLGIGIAFDDFGTGYASLTMLKEIPITRLKIDRSFVRNIENDRKDQAIVDAISRMAAGCGLDVIAEGIETPEQADFMKSHASEAQGFLYGRPMTASAFEAKYGLAASAAVA